jgi:hypothetical protein
VSLILKLIILFVLAALAVQDFKSRSVYWFWTPVLIFSFMGLNIFRLLSFDEYWLPVISNLLFIGLQLLVLSIYFSIKQKRFINITSQLLGWGDILFFLSIAFYLSVLNFLFFYIASLIVVLCCWLPWQAFSKVKDRHIPLAGLQSLLLILFLVADWYCFHFNATDDRWLYVLRYYEGR